MKVLIVEDDAKIKAEAIDPWLASLGFESDWAQSQEQANGLLVASEYDLILLDLKIPSRPGGQDVPEFGKNLLKQIRARKGRDVPVILITGDPNREGDEAVRQGLRTRGRDRARRWWLSPHREDHRGSLR